MGVNIVSGATTDVVTVDPTSKALRVSLYDTAGNKTFLGGNPAYVANTGPITGATAVSVKSLALIFHPNTVTKRYSILRIHVNQIAGVAGTQRIELNRITADGATGTLATIVAKDLGDTASLATLRFNAGTAPTRAAGILVGADMPVSLAGNFDIPLINTFEVVEGKPFIARASIAEGYEVVQNVITTITTAPVFNISWEWIEV